MESNKQQINMRIISGKLKGSVLFMPKDKNTRPLKDLARESVFNLLTHSKKSTINLINANVLDLYAGTGSFGLECLSRGAKNICFIENNKSAFNILQKNIEKLKIKKKTQSFFSDVFLLINKQIINRLKFDLIFCDPPFKNTNLNELIELIFDKKLLNKNGIIILHRNNSSKEIFPKCFNILDERIYGKSKITFANFLA